MSGALNLSAAARAIEPTLIRSLREEMTASTIDLGLGQTDLAIADAVRDHLRRQLEGETRTPYTPNAGGNAGRQAVAEHVGVRPGEVLLTCGVQEGLAVSILGLCGPEDEVLIPNPGFPAYANLVRASGAEPVGYHLGAPTEESPGWSLEPEAVVEQLNSRTSLVVLNNPSNPTGSVFEDDVLDEVLKELRERDIGWISDEIYEDYSWERQFVSARTLESAGDGIVLSGLSKSHHMMGWRLGWMIGPEEMLEALTPLHQHLVTCAPRPAQEAAVAALDVHDSVVQDTRAVFGRRRRTVLETLRESTPGCSPVAEGAFYVFLDVRPYLDGAFDTSLQMAKTLLAEADVMVVPGEGFGPGGLGHLRIAYTIGGEELNTGLERICGFLHRHRPDNGD